MPSTVSSSIEWDAISSVARSDLELQSDSTALAALSRRAELMELALDKIRQGMCVFDGHQRLLLFNRQYAEMHSIDPSRLWVGMTLRDVVDLRYSAGTGPDMLPEEYARWRDRISLADRPMQTEVTLRNGNVHLVHHEPLPGGGWVAAFEDITERRRAEAGIRHMAHHDTLTGLASRCLFNDRLDGVLARMRGADGLEHYRPNLDSYCKLISAVLLLDLDHFKDVNDRLGHAAGDELLCQVAARISVQLRPQDTFARLGGDEFAILLDGIGETGEAAALAARVIQDLTEPFVLDGQAVAVGASVGIALCSPDNHIPEPVRLLRNADRALYQAKAAGRGTYCFSKAGQLRMHDAGVEARFISSATKL